MAADVVELVDEDQKALVQLHRLRLNLIDVLGDLRLLDRHRQMIEITRRSEVVRMIQRCETLRLLRLLHLTSPRGARLWPNGSWKPLYRICDLRL